MGAVGAWVGGVGVAGGVVGAVGGVGGCCRGGRGRWWVLYGWQGAWVGALEAAVGVGRVLGGRTETWAAGGVGSVCWIEGRMIFVGGAGDLVVGGRVSGRLWPGEEPSEGGA